MRSRRALGLLLAGAAILVVAGAIWEGRGGSSVRGVARITRVTPAVAKVQPPGEHARPAVLAASLQTLLEELLARFSRGAGGEADLTAFREALHRADPREAMAAVLEFLRTGRDAPTGAVFAVGTDGLAGAPTLRVFLMDLLGQLARQTGSGAADAYARTVLEAKTSPDEWAVLLRNVGWSEPNATGYLAGKLREMLAEPVWIGNPTPALLESFDVAVFAGDPSMMDQLSGFAQGDTVSLKRAALVAMDRLSEKSPQAVMEYLNANPAVMAERPLVRADYFAKADLTQPAQQAAVETYLAREDVSLAEKTKLIEELSAPGSFVSENLLTQSPGPVDANARQQVVTATVQRWVEGNRFPELRAVLEANRR